MAAARADDREGLLALADAALYRAKSKGRNRVESARPAAEAYAAPARDRRLADA